MKKHLTINNQRYFEFIKTTNASDLIEIWLFAHCIFCVTTGTGPDTLPNVYRRPTLFLNMLPLLYLHDYHHTLTVPKHLSWKDTGRLLTLNEHLEHDYLRDERYDQNGIVITDLNSKEILEATKEFYERFFGIFEQTQENLDLQNCFWFLFTSSKKYNLHHNWKHPEARVGEKWLSKTGMQFFNKN
ncbi:TIGR04372 family glycosyltransferase [Alphaproteobacteria bacterium]|nr:TIGR04372 family glycosyltransferase [Alphaproteobacteria bacterium]